jgi:peptidyl-prolyl cis-trans isomerase D
MFEAVRSNKRIAQFILALLVVPFAFFGMDAYFSNGPRGSEVARVGGSKISVVEFDQALREQQARLRQAMGGEVDRAMLDSEAIRRSVVESLVNQRLLALHAAESHLIVTPQQLQQVIAGVPAFQTDGHFSIERYDAAIRAQGMTPAVFEARVAQDLRVQQMSGAVGESAFASRTSARRFLAAQLEERKVREIKFPPDRFVSEVKLAEDAARQYYDANPSRFERPARLRADYVVFDQEAVGHQIAIPDEEVRKYYDANTSRFGQPEERNVRHILITAAADAPADEVAKAAEKAAAILAQLRKNPARFTELAKAESQDPGSAEKGGELGFFGRGVMPKPFDDAAFSLEKGKISDVVRSDFGFHILEVVDIKPATIRSFEAAKGEIVEELKRQAAGRRFAELAEQFTNMVYEQSDSLEPVAEALKLEIRHADWTTREGAIGEFRNEKLLNTLFSEESVKNRRNVEAIEVASGTLVSARVTDFEPAQRLPFEQTKAEIERQLRSEEAAKLAVARGEAALAALVKGEAAPAEWSEVQTLQRGKSALAPAAIEAVFGAPAGKLPAHVGVATPDGGYSVFRIEEVRRPELANDDPRVKSVMQQYQRLIADRDFSAFIASLRARYKVEINDAALRAQPSQQ